MEDSPAELHVVTGAFGYSGRYIARTLLEQGKRVRTLTKHAGRLDPFGSSIDISPLAFDEPSALVESLRGASVLYNTYWVRFERGAVTFDEAVSNSRILIDAAREAGVGRLVHISVTQPSEESPYPYFRGKAAVERVVSESGLPYAMLRPALLFGREDILINNIAWLLRRLPVFGVFGTGGYLVQPAYVGDVAGLAVALGATRENVIVDAVGPETYTFLELVLLLRERVRSRSRIIHVPPAAALAVGRVIGRAMRDVVITRDEIGGLMANLLVSGKPPTCATRFSDWVTENAGALGRAYASELARHFR